MCIVLLRISILIIFQKISVLIRPWIVLAERDITLIPVQCSVVLVLLQSVWKPLRIIRVLHWILVSPGRTVVRLLQVLLLANNYARRYAFVGLCALQNTLLLIGCLVFAKFARAFAIHRVFLRLIKLVGSLILLAWLLWIWLRFFLFLSIRRILDVFVLIDVVILNFRSDQFCQLLRGQVLVILGKTARKFLTVRFDILYDLLALLELLL